MTSAPDEKTVLAKAVLVAASRLGLELTDALNLSSIASLNDTSQIDPESQTGERAILLVRLSVALTHLCGDDPAWIAHFMGSPNRAIGGVPAQQISTAEGLASVVQVAEKLARR